MGGKPRSCIVILWILPKDQGLRTRREPRLKTTERRVEKKESSSMPFINLGLLVRFQREIQLQL